MDATKLISSHNFRLFILVPTAVITLFLLDQKDGFVKYLWMVKKAFHLSFINLQLLAHFIMSHLLAFKFKLKSSVYLKERVIEYFHQRKMALS